MNKGSLNRKRFNTSTFKKMLVDNKAYSLVRFKLASQQVTLAAEGSKGFSNRNRWRFSKKTRSLLAFVIIMVIVISFFVFLPRGNQSIPTVPQSVPQSTDNPIPVATPNTAPQTNNNTRADVGQQVASIAHGWHPGLPIVSPVETLGVLESAQSIDNATWRAIAANAWKYYQPGKGVDSNTGLPWTTQASPYITDWDIGVYIQAVIDASKLGLVENSSDWGFNGRIEKVLTFLETRQLNNASYPFWFYQANDRQVWRQNSDTATLEVDTVDTGRLFVALNNLRTYYPGFATRVNNLVNNVNGNRSDYHKLVSGLKNEDSKSIYAYYYVSGFASFWPDELSNTTNTILNNIISADNVTINGVKLPKSSITADVLLCSIFETKNDSRLMTLSRQVYSAHEAYYNDTLRYRAFGEGPSISTDWQWEWVVLSDGRTWTVLNGANQVSGVSPIVYTKVAFGFLALYNTSFAISMSIYLEHNLPDTTYGYGEGINEVDSPHSLAGSLTNGLILGAAQYFVTHNIR